MDILQSECKTAMSNGTTTSTPEPTRTTTSTPEPTRTTPSTPEPTRTTSTHKPEPEPTPAEEPEYVRQSRWWSIRVMYLSTFVSSVSFSICVSSLYPYLKILDPSADTNFVGWIMAVYSIGQLVASPLFGIWANRRVRTREPLLAALAISILGSLLYMELQSFRTAARSLIIVARLLTGISAGCIAAIRSYVSGATTTEERTSAVAILAACQVIAFIMGPLIQTAMVPIGYPGVIDLPGLYLDMYTAPAFFVILLSIINIVLLITIFREHRVDDESTPKSDTKDPNAGAENDYQLDYLAVFATLAIFFSALFIFAMFETISTPMTMHMFSWTKAEATLYVGIVLGAAGLVAIFVCIIITILSKRFDERYILLGGFMFFMIGTFGYLPWGNRLPEIQRPYITHTALETTGLHSTIQPMMNTTELLTTTEMTMSTTTEEAVGCPSHYDWCYNTPALPLWQYCVGTFFLAVGYAANDVMTCTIYSKILGPKPQGIWMGFLSSTGSLSRALGPVFVSQVYDAYGPRITFGTLLVLLLFTVLGILLVFRRLVPCKMIKTLSIASDC